MKSFSHECATLRPTSTSAVGPNVSNSKMFLLLVFDKTMFHNSCLHWGKKWGQVVKTPAVTFFWVWPCAMFC